MIAFLPVVFVLAAPVASPSPSPAPDPVLFKALKARSIAS